MKRRSKGERVSDWKADGQKERRRFGHPAFAEHLSVYPEISVGVINFGIYSARPGSCTLRA